MGPSVAAAPGAAQWRWRPDPAPCLARGVGRGRPVWAGPRSDRLRLHSARSGKPPPRPMKSSLQRFRARSWEDLLRLRHPSFFSEKKNTSGSFTGLPANMGGSRPDVRQARAAAGREGTTGLGSRGGAAPAGIKSGFGQGTVYGTSGRYLKPVISHLRSLEIFPGAYCQHGPGR